jgi:hypothetical protein
MEPRLRDALTIVVLVLVLVGLIALLVAAAIPA